MNFSTWLLNEGQLYVTTAPGLESVREKAAQALSTYLNRYNGPELASASSRYRFNLDKYDNSWGQEQLFFSYSPIEKNRGSDEMVSPDDYRYDFFMNHYGGKTGYRLYKTPKDALENIPANPNFGYRGMSWEEWKKTRNTGQVQSMGVHNFMNQGNLTFYGPTPDTAESYAGGFAPMAFKPTPVKPGVVIAVPRQFLKDHTQNPNIPQGELAHEGPLSAKEIAEVYILVATASRAGRFDLIVTRGKVSEGSRSDLGVRYAIRRLQ